MAQHIPNDSDRGVHDLKMGLLSDALKDSYKKSPEQIDFNDRKIRNLMDAARQRIASVYGPEMGKEIFQRNLDMKRQELGLEPVTKNAVKRFRNRTGRRVKNALKWRHRGTARSRNTLFTFGPLSALRERSSRIGRQYNEENETLIEERDRFDTLSFQAYEMTFFETYGMFLDWDGNSNLNQTFETELNNRLETEIEEKKDEKRVKDRPPLAVARKYLSMAENSGLGTANDLMEAAFKNNMPKNIHQAKDDVEEAEEGVKDVTDAKKIIHGSDTKDDAVNFLSSLSSFKSPTLKDSSFSGKSFKNLKIVSSIEYLKEINESLKTELEAKTSGGLSGTAGTVLTGIERKEKSDRRDANTRLVVALEKELQKKLPDVLGYLKALKIAKTENLVDPDPTNVINAADVITEYERFGDDPTLADLQGIATSSKDIKFLADTDFNNKIVEKEEALKDAQKELKKSEEAPLGKLTDLQAAKRIMDVIVSKQFPNSTVFERQNIIDAALLEGITDMENLDSFIDSAKRSGARIYELSTAKRARDFGTMVRRLRVAGESPFENVDIKDFYSTTQLSAKITHGEWSLENAFYMQTALNHFDQAHIGDKKESRVRRSLQGIAVEKAIKKRLAEEAGLTTQDMLDPLNQKQINLAFDENLEKFAKIWGIYADKYTNNRFEIESNRKREFQLQLKMLNEQKRAGQIPIVEWKEKRREILKKMREEGFKRNWGLGKNFVISDSAYHNTWLNRLFEPDMLVSRVWNNAFTEGARRLPISLVKKTIGPILKGVRNGLQHGWNYLSPIDIGKKDPAPAEVKQAFKNAYADAIGSVGVAKRLENYQKELEVISKRAEVRTVEIHEKFKPIVTLDKYIKNMIREVDKEKKKAEKKEEEQKEEAKKEDAKIDENKAA